jgi:cysteinyl-tRNA synthetase
MDIYLFNSLTRKVDLFKPLVGNEVRMYSCGPTVYNYAHIGNMRAFLFADLLQRVLRTVGGYNLKWVMNITNIDDKTIRDSAFGSDQWKEEMGEQSNDSKDNLSKLTEFYELAFLDDISKLGINLEHLYAMPRATEFIPEMQDLVRLIFSKGYAYISEGSVYFNVGKWRKDDFYGKLFYIDFENFRSGTRIDADQYEREQVSDFVLWKARKPLEPYWEFEIDGIQCDGRPGWHLECSAMEKELLSLPFDIHTGGVDLKFPHHEDEIAQSKSGYGIEPTAFWCHNEFLEVEGKKMAKSLGNFFTLRDLIEKGFDPLDIRFSMFSAHYASTYNFTLDGISAAHKGRQRIQDYIHDLHEPASANLLTINIAEAREKIFRELGNDLHTPKALAEIFTFINQYPPENLNESTKKEAINLFKELNDIFDIWEIGPRKDIKIVIPKNIVELASRRWEAKQSQKWAEADILRNEILAAGYIIKDSKNGYTIDKN